MKQLNVIILAAFLLGLTACNEDKIFEKEQYKNVFALVSDDDYNVFSVVHNLGEAESIGYVAASCGGTNTTTQEIRITMEENDSLFNLYNKGNYDTDIDKYANLLPADKYTIDDYNFTIPAGERSGRMKLRVRPEGLSPDSVYFVSLRVANYSAYEVNPDKDDILYRVLIKNKYATQEYATNYDLRGSKNGIQTQGVKQMHPISANKVRIMAGTETFQADTTVINKFGLILEIDATNHVHISSYKNITVQQIDGDAEYPNIFLIEDDGYKTHKTFLLRYSYKDGNTTHQMKEELRLEFKE
ncbi:MAG: hypothetical protein EZS26_000839 [Candidatus Ordinivivax streblomastigis]|uniref:DUF4361 domain-containing protein n=1 Tax=Candidatus Ordinivivax streblomastigis TaxID=2540710 RepID=A0A5M8P3H4_9BACT|nr:MAG: hypothetical protein EZS26_000839 [Candidatus Ordinivivax streblomastigis]